MRHRHVPVVMLEDFIFVDRHLIHVGIGTCEAARQTTYRPEDDCEQRNRHPSVCLHLMWFGFCEDSRGARYHSISDDVFSRKMWCVRGLDWDPNDRFSVHMYLRKWKGFESGWGVAESLHLLTSRSKKIEGLICRGGAWCQPTT